MENKTLVAVYGSLRRGMGNSRLMSMYNTDGKDGYLSDAKVDGFSMRSCGGYPAIVKHDGGNPVLIELYNVNDETFDALDGLEGYPSFYNREQVETPEGDAWIYFQEYETNVEAWGADHVVDGDWVKYLNGENV